MNIEVRYYAGLREQRGQPREQVSTQAGTVGDLYDELKQRHGLTMDAHFLRAAVNQQYVSWTSVLTDGDIVIFMPPVAGG